MSGSDDRTPGLLDERLRLGAGFSLADRRWVVRILSGLAQHLSGWQAEQIDVEVSVKEREGRDQQVMLEVRIARWQPVVAHSDHKDLDHALVEVRKELIRQIEDEKSRRDPSQHRETIKRTT